MVIYTIIKVITFIPMLNKTELNNNVDNLSGGIAERFILFLKKIAYGENKQPFSERMLNMSNDKAKNEESKLIKALNKNIGVLGVEPDYDLEDELASKWSKDSQYLGNNLPLNLNHFWQSSGFKVKMKDKFKLLLPPNYHFILPSAVTSNHQNKNIVQPAPGVKMATLILAIFMISVFMGVATPGLTVKLALKTDEIILSPFGLFFKPKKLAMDQNNFIDNISRLISQNKNLKADFIRKNRQKLQNVANSQDYFLITKDEILGLSVDASQLFTDKNTEYTWKENTDLIIWQLAQWVENFLNKLSDTQEKFGQMLKL